MKNFHSLLQDVLTNEQDQFNTRTKKICRAVVGRRLEYDLRDGFPALTTKKLAFNAMKGELLGFFRGSTSAAEFRELDCKIWDANANETVGWLNNPNRKGVDDLGPIYGKQWRDWTDSVIVNSVDARDALISKGYKEIMVSRDVGSFDDQSKDIVTHRWLLQRGINQLENALRKLISDPSDRRIIVSGWNVAELDRMALPPCHMDYRFVAFDGKTREARKVLNLVMTIRSWDLFLGAPFNIAETALFLEIMARLADMDAGIITIQATNAHIYEDHYEQVKELLTREHFSRPRLWLSHNIKPVSLDGVSGAFESIVPSDIRLEGYQSHAAIKAPMSA